MQELEKFADILVSTEVTLREHKRLSELQPGSLLFTIVLKKIPQTMLSRFYKWVRESGRQECLEDLRDWITEESEYQVKALETAEGFGARGKSKKEDRRLPSQTFTAKDKKLCFRCLANSH